MMSSPRLPIEEKNDRLGIVLNDFFINGYWNVNDQKSKFEILNL